jgi:hypothetical protein
MSREVERAPSEQRTRPIRDRVPPGRLEPGGSGSASAVTTVIDPGEMPRLGKWRPHQTGNGHDPYGIVSLRGDWSPEGRDPRQRS